MTILKKGDSIYTNDGTMLVVTGFTVGAVFEEWAYNTRTQDFDILYDEFRVLNKSEIENIMNDYDGRSHFVKLDIR